MQLIKQIRIRLHDALLKKISSSFQVARRSVSLQKAEFIGILFDGTEPEERETVLNFAKQLKEQDKRVKLLAFFDNNLKSQHFAFHHFNRRHLSFALRPQSQDAIEFAEQPFDLLLNLSSKSILPLDFIAAHSKAKFRVGPYTDKLFCYDLMIEPSGKKDLNAFLEEVIFYLTKMQPNYEAAIV